MPKATQLTVALKACLEGIKPSAGYVTEVRQVYGLLETPKDKAPTPYIKLRVADDRRTSTAGIQATRVRTYLIEAFFAKSAAEAELDAVGPDILRALGFGLHPHERALPGLIDQEDEIQIDPCEAGAVLHRVTVTVGVTYVESYQ
ncbi:hypothetical protein PKB_1283 [Pseudomonas knackmussii B13]|uniref:Tail terminator n=1 Tax=Pseudomonas knackmussii (strain DSM 6978 / CCUG 54928 / LMG 23759 / B13) TaxID=1301098 RepID=A0A024HDX3_PSEKB|nr:hypothetical protein [Pseudomonas knackmussii]CDF82648.1 hypothetical protein PKB_1283 [Pseudomonas knackmussii B13]